VTIRVAIIEDHPLVLESVTSRLDDEKDIQVVGTATHGAELFNLVRDTSPDVVVLDLGMSTGGQYEPLTAVKTLRQTHPEVQVLVFTGYDEGVWVRGLIEAGAMGYVLKSDGLGLLLPEAVRELHAGRRFYSPSVSDKFFASESANLLTDAQVAVLRLAAHGYSNASIGQKMGISEKTVCNYLSAIYGRMGIRNDPEINRRVMAINKARDLGILPRG
jgi:DNA-binding NarL/FixJ family response regulator